MKARLRDRMPLRFRNAITVARRTLYCERLESRCLLHGVPLAIDYPAEEAADEFQIQESPLAALVQQPSTPQSYPNLNVVSPVADDRSEEASDLEAPSTLEEASTLEETSGDASELHEGDDQESFGGFASEETEPAEAPDSFEPIDLDGLPEPEGEAVPFSATGSSGAIHAGSQSTGLSDAFTTARANAPLGDAGISLPVSRGTTGPDGPNSLGASADRQSQNALSSAAVSNALNLTNDEPVSPAFSNAGADRSVGSAPGIEMSLISDVQSQGNLSESGLTQSSLSQNTLSQNSLSQGSLSQSLQTHADSATPSPWLFARVEPASAVADAGWAVSSVQHLVEAMRSIDTENASSLSITRLASDLTERPAIAEAAGTEDPERGLYALRAAVEQYLQQRYAQRASAFSLSEHKESVQQASASAEQAYLRVREGSDGLVELAIERSPTFDYATEAGAVETAGAPSGHNWSGASVGIFHEFDLATSSNERNPDVSHSESFPVGKTGMLSDVMDHWKAIDAAHADDESSNGEAGSVGEATLPLGLLALTGLLAVSRHRFTRKLRQQ